MPTPAEMARIANSLIESTDAGDLTWSAGSEDEGGYVARSARFAFVIRSRDDDDQAPYVFEVTLIEGGVSFGSYTTHSSTSSDTLRAMRTLYDRAKLNAHGLGESLSDEVLKDLQ